MHKDPQFSVNELSKLINKKINEKISLYLGKNRKSFDKSHALKILAKNMHVKLPITLPSKSIKSIKKDLR